MSASASEPLSIRRAEPGAQVPWNYSQTPSGTIYSSTPGGSRIIYDRSTLLALASSPLAKSPPGNLDYIKNVISSSHEGSQQHLTPQTALQHSHHQNHGQGHNGHIDVTHNHEKHGKGQHQTNPRSQSLDKNKEEMKAEANKSNINPYALLSKEDDVFEMDMEL